jgi:hypothetical protein
LSARWCALATAVPKARAASHVHPAQPPGSQGRGSGQRVGAPCSLQNHSRLDGRRSQRLIARRWRAREHEEPRSSDPSRAVVLRLDGQHIGRIRFPVARLNVAGPTLESIQGGREEEDGRGVLTMGQRCSCGRLGVDGGAV